MKDKTYILPNQFLDGKACESYINFYKTDKSSKNNKVTFQQNLICFLITGNKEIYNKEMRENMDSNSIFILPTGNVLMTEKTTDKNEYKSILFFFSDSYFINFINRYDLKFPKNELQLNSIKIKKNNYLINFEQSLEILEQELKYSPLLNIKLEEILMYLYRHHIHELNTVMDNIHNRNQNLPLITVVHNNLNNNLTVEELAFLCNMSLSTFKRKFQETFNTTPKKYFIEHRMQKAVFYLKQNKKPSEIYFELGYENPSAFNNEFKKHFGVPPKMYMLQS